ncbi:MAG: helix-turn-helix transcriptional regulator [Ruminococcaceae bacterium]|nr:helix-turn-helix transcriptional regulator [Oscillospiraceae bacterium]
MNNYLNKNGLQDNLNLELLHFGYASVNKEWHGQAVRSQTSRLYFIKSGSFFIIDADGIRTDFNEGGIYLIPSGYSYIYGCESENEHYFFHIRLYGFDKMDILGRFKKSIFCKIKPDFDRLAKYIDFSSATASLVIKSEIYRALSEISINYSGIFNMPIYSKEVGEAISYISCHLKAHLTVSEIASAINLANSTLSAKFKREVKMSVGEYVDYRVILTAMQMLISSQKSISEISCLLGFCDQFYFSRRFKKRYGICPQEFRKIKNVF